MRREGRYIPPAVLKSDRYNDSEFSEKDPRTDTSSMRGAHIHVYPCAGGHISRKILEIKATVVIRLDQRCQETRLARENARW